MPINKYQTKPSFSESYYRNKFDMKARQLFHHIQRYPDDEVAKGQFKFISDVLEKDDDKISIIWQEWEKNNFCWPIENIIPERYKK